MKIIEGQEFGYFETLSMSIGIAKRVGSCRLKSHYVAILGRNSCVPKPYHNGISGAILWEEDFPELVGALLPHAASAPNIQGVHLVDLQKAKSDVNCLKHIKKFLHIPGGVFLEYKLTKGACYQNDIDGQPVYVKIDGQLVHIKGKPVPVIKDIISVFCIIDHATDDGKVEYHWLDKCSLMEQGFNIESQFYRTPVDTNSKTTDITKDADCKESVLTDEEYIYSQARLFCKNSECENYKSEIQTDYNKAFRFFKISAKMGNAEAQCCLGCCFRHGQGTSINYAEARKWYNESANNGCARALRHIATCYIDGHGVERDSEKAIKWYKKAAGKGDVESMNILGDILEPSEKFKWFMKSAKMGDSTGQLNVGYCYDMGIGTNWNPFKAYEWYQRAAEQGNTEAEELMKKLCIEQNGEYIYGDSIPNLSKLGVINVPDELEHSDYDGLPF